MGGRSGMHMGGGYLRDRTRFLESLPIPQIETSESEMISKIIKLVEKIDAIVKKNKKINWNEKIQEYLKQINLIVYKLYGLIKEEIEFVENKIV